MENEKFHPDNPDDNIDLSKIEKEKIPELVEFGKVRLERMRPEHKELLHELLSDKEHIRYTEFTEEDRTEEGCEEIINGWGEYFPFVVYDSQTNEPIGIELIYKAECPYKKDAKKADEWKERNQNTWESGRVFKKGVSGYGTDTKKGSVIFSFRHLKADAYTGACAPENQAPIKSLIRAGLRPDPEFRGNDLDGVVKDGINEEGFKDQFGQHCKELRLKITKDEFEQLEKEGIYNH